METKDFLSLFPNHLITSISDVVDEGRKKIISHGITLDEAEEYNTLKNKCGIYFTPNGDFGIGGKRIEAEAKNIYALIVDVDKKEDTRSNSGLIPSLIVQTGKGNHLYFLLDNPISYEKFKNDFRICEEKLIDILDGDKQCKDVTRLLRVPGFKYRKDNQGEKIITVLDKHLIIPKYDFFKLYSLIEELHKPALADEDLFQGFIKEAKFGKKTNIRSSYAKIFDDIKQVNVEQVLWDLYPEFDPQKNGGIKEGGKMTGGYKINIAKNYVHSFSGKDRPEGGPFSVAKKRFGSSKEAIEYFSERRGVKIEKQMKDKIKKGQPVAEDVGDTKVHLVGHSCGLYIDYANLTTDYYLGDREGQYFNGIVDTVGYVEIDRIEYRILEIRRSGYENKIFLLKPFGSLSDFNKQLLGQGIVCGEEKQLLKLFMQHVTANCEKYYFVNKLGMQIIAGEKVYISKCGLYVDKERKIYVDIGELEGLEIGKCDDFSVCDKGRIKQYITTLSQAYDLHVSYLTFLNIALGYNSFFFRAAKQQLPSMFVLGLSQSGKTRTRELQMMYGFGTTFKIAASSKLFSYEKLAKHYICIPAEEYRNSALGSQKEAIEAFIRIIYDGGIVTKGTQGQNLNKYELNCNRLFDGETPPDDDASLTRLGICIAEKRHIGKLYEYQNLPHILPDVLGVFKDQKDFDKFMSEVHDLTNYLAENTKLERDNARMLYNYSLYIALGRRLGLAEYENVILDNMRRQDVFLAQDNIQMVYMKVFNLTNLFGFEVRLYDGGVIVDIVEEAVRGLSITDLKGYIKTVNERFRPGDRKLGYGLFVDLAYVFKNETLRNSFKNLTRRISISEHNTPEQRKTMAGITEFLKQNFNNDPLYQEWLQESNRQKKAIKETESNF